MSGTHTNPITDHLAACTRLRRDARSVVDELHAQLLPGGEKLSSEFAVDFSEIYSLIFPHKTATEMRVFDTTHEASSRVVQLDALRYLFTDGPYEPVLLRPYAIEFRSVIGRLRAGLLNDIIERAMASWRQMEQILKVPDIDRIVAAGTHGTLTDVEVTALWAVFEEHAAELLVLTEDAPQPLVRITEIINSGRLRDLPSSTDFPGDDDVRQRWFDKLHDARGHDKDGASYVDAVAMATVHQVNREWVKAGRRLVLITRSDAMQHVFENEFDEGLWNDAGGYVIRHPRTFTSLYRSSDDPRKLIEELTQRQLSIELFVKSVEEKGIAPTKPLGPADNEWVSQEIAAIRDAWERTEVLSSSDLLDHAAATTTDAKSMRGRLTAVLTMLANRQVFHDLVSRRLTELLTGIEQQHEFFGFRLHADPLRDEQFIQPFTKGNKTLLTSSRYWVPITLQFSSEELTQWAHSLQTADEVEWHEVIEFFRAGFSGPLDYERLLAMAYLLANLGKWALAEDFCARSVQHPEAIKARPHEAFYFLAICKRKNDFTPQRFIESLDHLESAQNFKRLAMKSSTYEDPRYLAERGAQIYFANKRAAADPGWRRTHVPRVSDARDLWLRAIDLPIKDFRLTAQLHNNLAYYYAVAEEPTNEKKTRMHLNKLVEAHSKVEPDMSRWNPLILETIAAVRLKLRNGKRDDGELVKLKDSISAAIARLEMMPEDRKAVMQTLEQIKVAIGEPELHAPPPRPPSRKTTSPA